MAYAYMVVEKGKGNAVRLLPVAQLCDDGNIVYYGVHYAFKGFLREDVPVGHMGVTDTCVMANGFRITKLGAFSIPTDKQDAFNIWVTNIKKQHIQEKGKSYPVPCLIQVKGVYGVYDSNDVIFENGTHSIGNESCLKALGAEIVKTMPIKRSQSFQLLKKKMELIDEREAKYAAQAMLQAELRELRAAYDNIDGLLRCQTLGVTTQQIKARLDELWANKLPDVAFIVNWSGDTKELSIRVERDYFIEKWVQPGEYSFIDTEYDNSLHITSKSGEAQFIRKLREGRSFNSAFKDNQKGVDRYLIIGDKNSLYLIETKEFKYKGMTKAKLNKAIEDVFAHLYPNR